jgi:hypothetical protein
VNRATPLTPHQAALDGGAVRKPGRRMGRSICYEERIMPPQPAPEQPPEPKPAEPKPVPVKEPPTQPDIFPTTPPGNDPMRM